MMSHRILSITAPEEWMQTLLSLPVSCRDVYFTPQYHYLHTQEDSAQAICLKYQENELTWCFPGLLNPIDKIGRVALPKGLFDLETAYGYGGPLSNSQDQDFLTRANQAFIEWAESNGIVAQFIRFHPLLSNEQWIKDDQLEIVFDRFTLSENISYYNAALPHYPKSARNAIDRGKRLGIETRVLDVDQWFPAFLDLYQKAMLKLGAESYYFFNRDYFNQLSSLVKDHGLLIGAMFKQKIIAAAIFLCGPNMMHYHLSASDFDNRLPGATNMILDLAFQEAKSMGLSQVHMGGGRTSAPDDSLLLFKKSMSTDTHCFHIGKRIYNMATYKDLVAIWEQEYPSLVEHYQNRLLRYRYQP